MNKNLYQLRKYYFLSTQKYNEHIRYYCSCGLEQNDMETRQLRWLCHY